MQVSGKYILLTLLSFTLFSCGEEEKKTTAKKPIVYKDIKEDLMDTNKEWFIQEKEEIDNFIRRRQWDVVTTGTGIRYAIYKKADTVNNPKATPGQVAILNFEVRLLENDSLCYESKDGSEWFLVEMDNIESGLHEAIQYLREGDKAKIILPSYLAHGLMGDMDRIPPQTPVLYDIELLELTTKEEIRKREMR